ncbi:histidine--tRNA ligase [Clostridium sp. BJN0001]|uniref:histidine--tRNA ligase n=1 Tax=Clostridium sp. BJN0001 TaxID=2930219 RepID=UPI001FD4B2DD|nr:histidine--tRNA ligase [Clostridium sp. BJN0001]
MKKAKITPSILPGFMELLPNEQKIFNDITNKITEVYQNNGCLPIDTPIIEKSEVLLAKSAGETEKQVYRFNKGSNDLSLRFDLTVPLSRFVAQHYNDLAFPFKRYQVGKVYRGERNQRGRYREFYQCDVDIIGNNKLSINNDAFVINLAYQALKKIGLKTFKFQISNRKILSGILEAKEIENINEVMILIDKYDKIGEDEFKSSLKELVGDEKASFLNEILKLNGTASEILESLKEFNLDNETLNKGIEELKTVTDILDLLGLEKESYEINLKIIRGLDYYTGTVFETFLKGNEHFGSVCSGGRYDNLAENYTNNVLPGMGVSIGLTRLFYVLKEIGFIDSYKIEPSIDYLIIPIGDTLNYCLKVYKTLLSEGKKVDIYLDNDKIKKKFTFADKIGAKNVIVIGEDEVSSNAIKVKNMETGEEKPIKLDLK